MGCPDKSRSLLIKRRIKRRFFMPKNNGDKRGFKEKNQWVVGLGIVVGNSFLILDSVAEALLK